MAVLSTSANIATPGLPVGSIQAFAGANAPTGWLLCDGSAVSRGNYPDLYNTIGTTYGSGDGSTTFNLPDLRGRVPAGKDNMGGNAANRLTAAISGITGTTLGNSGGNESMQSHYHNYYRVTTSGGAVNTGGDIIWAVSGGNVVDKAGSGYLRTDTLGGNTGSGASQNVQPTLVVNYIIKAVADIARGGWYTQSSPPVVTQLPTNPAIGDEVYFYTTNGAFIHQRWNGSTWAWLSHSKPPSVRCTISASTQIIATGVQTSIQWTGTDTYDTDSMHDPSVNNTRITFNTAGAYAVSFGLMFTNITNLCDLLIMKNGTGNNNRILEDARYMSTYGNASTSFVTNFAAGDWITADLYHTTGSSVTIQATERSYFSATWLGQAA